MEQVPQPTPAGLSRIRLEDIAHPGAYIRLGTGDVIRVTPGTGREEATTLPDSGAEPVYVVQISGNPYVPISEARMAAANLDIEINF